MFNYFFRHSACKSIIYQYSVFETFDTSRFLIIRVILYFLVICETETALKIKYNYNRFMKPCYSQPSPFIWWSKRFANVSFLVLQRNLTARSVSSLEVFQIKSGVFGRWLKGRKEEKVLLLQEMGFIFVFLVWITQ